MNTIICCARCREPRRDGAIFCYRCGLCLSSDPGQINPSTVLGLADQQQAAMQQSQMDALLGGSQQNAEAQQGVYDGLANILGLGNLLP